MDLRFHFTTAVDDVKNSLASTSSAASTALSSSSSSSALGKRPAPTLISSPRNSNAPEPILVSIPNDIPFHTSAAPQSLAYSASSSSDSPYTSPSLTSALSKSSSSGDWSVTSSPIPNLAGVVFTDEIPHQSLLSSSGISSLPALPVLHSYSSSNLSPRLTTHGGEIHHQKSDSRSSVTSLIGSVRGTNSPSNWSQPQRPQPHTRSRRYTSRARKLREAQRAIANAGLQKTSNAPFNTSASFDDNDTHLTQVCSVCLSGNVDVVVYPCAHRFHSDCILQWIETARNVQVAQQFTCPLCRTTMQQFVPLKDEQPRRRRDMTQAGSSSALKFGVDSLPRHRASTPSSRSLEHRDRLSGSALFSDSENTNGDVSDGAGGADSEDDDDDDSDDLEEDEKKFFFSNLPPTLSRKESLRQKRKYLPKAITIPRRPTPLLISNPSHALPAAATSFSLPASTVATPAVNSVNTEEEEVKKPQESSPEPWNNEKRRQEMDDKFDEEKKFSKGEVEDEVTHTIHVDDEVKSMVSATLGFFPSSFSWLSSSSVRIISSGSAVSAAATIAATTGALSASATLNASSSSSSDPAAHQSSQQLKSEDEKSEPPEDDNLDDSARRAPDVLTRLLHAWEQHYYRAKPSDQRESMEDASVKKIVVTTGGEQQAEHSTASVHTADIANSVQKDGMTLIPSELGELLQPPVASTHSAAELSSGKDEVKTPAVTKQLVEVFSSFLSSFLTTAYHSNRSSNSASHLANAHPLNFSEFLLDERKMKSEEERKQAAQHRAQQRRIREHQAEQLVELARTRATARRLWHEEQQQRMQLARTPTPKAPLSRSQANDGHYLFLLPFSQDQIHLQSGFANSARDGQTTNGMASMAPMAAGGAAGLLTAVYQSTSPVSSGAHRSFSVNLRATSPAVALYFTTYEHMKNAFGVWNAVDNEHMRQAHASNTQSSSLQQLPAYFTAAFAGGSASQLWQIAATSYQPGAGLNFGAMAAQCAPRSFLLLPLRLGTQFAVFEGGKAHYSQQTYGDIQHHHERDPHATPTSLLHWKEVAGAAALGGLVAGLVTFPLTPKSAVQTAGRSLRGAMKGMGMHLVRLLPGCVVTAVSYELALRMVNSAQHSTPPIPLTQSKPPSSLSTFMHIPTLPGRSDSSHGDTQPFSPAK